MFGVGCTYHLGGPGEHGACCNHTGIQAVESGNSPNMKSKAFATTTTSVVPGEPYFTLWGQGPMYKLAFGSLLLWGERYATRRCAALVWTGPVMVRQGLDSFHKTTAALPFQSSARNVNMRQIACWGM